jgi:ribosomal protein L37AE/L43A
MFVGYSLEPVECNECGGPVKQTELDGICACSKCGKLYELKDE